MYIIQMADLHIGSSEKTFPSETKFIHKIAELIKRNVPPNSTMLICLCGDIIDSKGLKDDKPEVQSRYQEAIELICSLMHLLEDSYTVSIRCCPGNHDITHGQEFHDFVKAVDNSLISLKQLQSSYTCQIENSNFIFVNSCANNQYKNGFIDYVELEKGLEKLPREDSKILVLHHAIMSMYEDDDSSIRDAAELVSLLDKYNISCVLHGHIHGRKTLTLGTKQCKVIGTGALFSRNNININSQFNIIQSNNGWVGKVLNCRYNADGGNSPWNICDLNDKSYENIFIGESFRGVYKQLLNKLTFVTPLYNVRLEIKNDYDKFSTELDNFLKDDYLKIGDKKYSYFDLAEKWEADEVPEELYFNHGSRFKVDGVTGIDFVKKKLKEKATSNRIVLSAYNMENIVKSFDDSVYLPSLESIQFGKIEENGELLVSMQLRALEANRFLKINICEIAYILKELRKEPNSVSFNKVNINISAFRVQGKERFNCFLKAGIDKLTPSKLGTKVNYGKIDEICKLLEEKRDGMETITVVKGIKTLFEAMEDSNEEAGENTTFQYTDEVLDGLKEVLNVYENLDIIHRSSSIQSDMERQCELEIDKLLGELIRKLRNLKK